MSEAETLRKDAKRAYKAGEFGAAVKLYTELVERPAGEGPQTLAADRLGYATALAALSRLDEAAVQLEHAIEHTPAEPRLRFKLGEVLSRLGRHPEAAAQLSEAARLDPGVADHHWRLAMELRTLGRSAEAAQALQRALKIDPNHTGAQIFQLEQLVVAGAERDGQGFEAEEAAVPDEQALQVGDVTPPSLLAAASRARPPLWRSHPGGLFIEAVALIAIGLWLTTALS